MSAMHLTPSQRLRIQDRLRTGSDASECRRLLALLELDRGLSVAEVASLLGTTRQTIYNCTHRFVVGRDPAALVDHYGPGRPKCWTESLRSILQESLEQRPDQFGYPDGNWTVELLREHLFHYSGRWLSDDSIRRERDRLGYVWKRCRYVLPPDPEREKKTRDFAAISGLAARQRQAGRGRNRPASVPAASGWLGEARPSGTGADHRQQRQAGRVRDH